MRTDTDAVMCLHSLEQKRKENERADKTAADQFLHAASLKPLRFQARYMSSQFDGTNARRDSEEAERSRWILTLSELIRGTSMPVGTLLKDTLEPAACGWRPASFFFLEEIVGTPAQKRFTVSALYGVIYRELSSSAQHGKTSQAGARTLSQMQAFLEQLVMNETSPLYLRVYSWWMLFQNWTTLRFSDQQEVSSSEVMFRGGAFHARLTRSKTIGQDKTIHPCHW